MNSQMRRSTGEINNLKQILANLELELSSTRKEADEYHKVSIEKNSDISGLETKVILFVYSYLITDFKLKIFFR